jgi:hypothetical protein
MGTRISSILSVEISTTIDNSRYPAPTLTALLRLLEGRGRSIATPKQGRVSGGSGVSHRAVTDGFVRKTHETRQDTSGGAPHTSRSSLKTRGGSAKISSNAALGAAEIRAARACQGFVWSGEGSPARPTLAVGSGGTRCAG